LIPNYIRENFVHFKIVYF